MGVKFLYSPQPEGVRLGHSSIHGNGIFATRNFPPGSVLGVSHIDDYSGQFQNDLIRTPLGGYINHSEFPNCHIIQRGKYHYIETIHDVQEGEEFTTRYRDHKCGLNRTLEN